MFPHTDEVGYRTDTYHYIEPDSESKLEQLSPTDVNPAAQNMIYATSLNRIVMTTTDIKLQICLGMVPGTTTYNIRGFWKSVT